MSWQDDLGKTGQNFQRQGDALGAQFRNEGDQAKGNADQYRGELDKYRQQLMESGGYSAEEADKILQSKGFDSLLYNQGDADKNFLSEDAQNEIRGNPWAAKNAYNTDNLYDVMGSGIKNQRGGFQSDTNRVGDALGKYKGGYDSAIDSAHLGPTDGYSGGQQSILGRGRGDMLNPLTNVAGSVEGKFNSLGRPIGVSDRYTNAMTVGDGELDQMRAVGANRQRAGNERMIQDVEARAAQGGNANALAVGDLGQKARQNSSQDEAAAAQAGDMAAREYRRSSEDTLEGRRMGGATAGANFSAQGIGAGIGLARDISGAGGDLMRAGLGQGADLEDRVYRGEAGTLGARMTAAGNVGAAGVNEAQATRTGRAGLESDVANREMGTADTDMMRKVSLEQSGEQAQQGRATDVMLNNQRTQQTNNADRYNRNYNIYGTNSNNNAKVADTRIGQQNLGGQVLAGQQNQQNTNYQAGQDRQSNTFGQTMSGVNNANSTYAQVKSQPGFWSKLLMAGVGAAGAAGAAYAGKPPGQLPGKQT